MPVSFHRNPLERRRPNRERLLDYEAAADLGQPILEGRYVAAPDCLRITVACRIGTGKVARGLRRRWMRYWPLAASVAAISSNSASDGLVIMLLYILGVAAGGCLFNR